MFTPIANIPGGSVITHGLYRYYDAGRSDSYPGTGTVVYDLSGNGSNGTLVGGMTYKNNYLGGYWDMDGNDDTITYTGVMQAAFTVCVVLAPGTDASPGSWSNDDGGFPGFRVTNGFVYAVQNINRSLTAILWNGGSPSTLTASSGKANATYFRMSSFKTNGTNEHNGYWNNEIKTTATNAFTRADSSSGTIYVGRDPVLTRYPTARLVAYLHYSRRLEDEEIYNNYAYFQNRFSLFQP